jgi:hypothetical protein
MKLSSAPSKIVASFIPVALLLWISFTIQTASAGPIVAGSAAAACYTACNAGYIVCMTASGLVAGTTGPVGWWAWLTSAAAGCSAIQGACMAAPLSLLQRRRRLLSAAGTGIDGTFHEMHANTWSLQHAYLLSDSRFYMDNFDARYLIL